MPTNEQTAQAPRPSIKVLTGSPAQDSISSMDSMKKEQFDSDVVPASGESDRNNSKFASTEFERPGKAGRLAYPALAILILGWWVSSIVVPLSQHRWLVQSLWAWFFLLVIIFRFVPASIISKPVSAAWDAALGNPLSRLPPRGRLALAWLGALGITFGTAFGMPKPEDTQLTDRIIALAGVYFMQLPIIALSHHKAQINWIRIPISIILQQALALFVFKSDAGIKIFTWFHTAVNDFEALPGEAAIFIFNADTVAQGWYFISSLAIMIWVASFFYMLYLFGWMQWLTKQFAWFGDKVLGASGVETVVALWSPWFGQVNSAILVGPYIPSLTESELGAVMATAMSSLASPSIALYTTKLGAPLRSLLAQSAAVIPSSIINAKVAFPETDAAVPRTKTRELAAANRKNINLRKAVELVDSLSDGAWIGLKVAGSVLTNLLMLYSLLLFVNGLLIWVFRGFGVHQLDLHLVIAAPLSPFVFFLGVPRREVWRISYIVSGKLLLNSDFAYAQLAQTMAGPSPFSPRGFNVASVALANTASLSSLGIQVGAMAALAPARKSEIARATIPALLVALMAAFQSAAISALIL